ncbi:hypothetical protein EXW35_28185 (plasmid) [Bacillus mycoides]|nr:hypothetical protein EXW35_28185 [Bacillus mycoides]QWI40992.1 hypothetical protein EXW43_28415 [Bacillus mycoides]
MLVVEEYVEIDIAVVLQRTNETHLESIDSYKNAVLSVYFYKKNSVFPLFFGVNFLIFMKMYLQTQNMVDN